MVDFYSKQRYDFDDLIRLVQVLRSPEGCPWDRVQTHESIRRNFIEEVYEACEAIDDGDPCHLKEELGDVLLHVVFHAELEAEAGDFDIHDVCDAVTRKMILRHPAIFGGETGLDWDEIKRREKGQTTLHQELSSVAKSLPALWRAEKLIRKAEKAGAGDPLPAMEQLRRALDAYGESESAENLGELLFAAVRAGISSGIDPEMALTARCEAFIAAHDGDPVQISKKSKEK